jgi:hypothetical protein
MTGAWQTPHGARPNREGTGWPGERKARAGSLEPVARAKQAKAVAELLQKASCVPARRAQLPGRSLEPASNGRPRGMTVNGGNAVQNSAYRSSITCGPCARKRMRGLSIHSKLRWVLLPLRGIRISAAGFRLASPRSRLQGASTYRSSITCGPQVREDLRAFSLFCNPERSEGSLPLPRW